jgi:Raf kinase inhibitor-like YbhB/YbcL family protein/uncharacterized protein (TIGR00297 family)
VSLNFIQPSSAAVALLIGFGLALIISAGAYWARALSLSGAAAAAFIGTFIFGLGGLPASVLLLTFFISSSLLSRLFSRRKNPLNEKFSKGSRRDAGQVLANGGVATVFILLTARFPGQSWAWAGFAGSLAAVNADTWATELGVLSRSEPRLITSGKRVERGASGGVSLFGSLAALAGGLLVGLFAVLFSRAALPGGVIGLTALGLSGLAGSLVDSLLGATVQAIYTCTACGKETERHPLHTCGAPTTLKRGWAWLDNDWVNVSCALAGAALAAGAWLIFPAALPALNPFDVSSSSGGAMITFPISSSSFAEGELIPGRYTCDGENRSPELAWKDLPQVTRSLALLVEDPDAPGGVFTHWVLYNLPATVRSLPEGQPRTATMPGNGTQGINDFRRAGYDGPCPPAGSVHRYYFKLMALDIDGSLPAGLNAEKLRKAVQGHILAEAQWVGRFGR